MAHLCIKHPHEVAESLCARCGASYCADCLVYPFGPAKPPYCIPCAVKVSGVRTTAGSRRMVAPKENKKRLKEWRKARKADLNSPPPDGVATWQRMDQAAADDADEEAAARAAAEREALRLPPPEPETPTPPPGVNLAPPGPGDWREEMDLGNGSGDPAAFGPPGDEPLLGYAPPDDSPLPDLGPAPVPAAESIGIDIGFGAPDTGFSGFDDTPPPAPPTPMPAVDLEPPATEPVLSEPAMPLAFSASFGLDDTPAAAPAEPVEEPAMPLAFQNQVVEDDPVALDPPGYTPSPFTESVTFGNEPERTSVLPQDFDPTDASFDAPAFDPTSFEPDPVDFEPIHFDPVPDPVGGAFSAPAFEPQPFEPEPDLPTPIAFEPAADPLAASFGTAPPEPPASLFAHDRSEPTEPAAAPSVPMPEPIAAPAPQPVAEVPPPVVEPDPAPPAPVPPAPAGPTFTPPSAPATSGDPGRAAIRPPTPTRIPAAKAEAKGGDAKEMLARIAALRSERDD